MAYEFFGKFTSETDLEELLYKYLKRDSDKYIQAVTKPIVRDYLEHI